MDGLRELRKKRNMTQEQIARRLHVSQQCIAKWESGTAMPRADKLAEYARELRCPVETILDASIREAHARTKNWGPHKA